MRSCFGHSPGRQRRAIRRQRRKCMNRRTFHANEGSRSVVGGARGLSGVPGRGMGELDARTAAPICAALFKESPMRGSRSVSGAGDRDAAVDGAPAIGRFPPGPAVGPPGIRSWAIEGDGRGVLSPARSDRPRR